MSWQESWLASYPDWPTPLLERFAIPIQIDLIKYTGADSLGFQPWWQSVIAPPAQANYTFSITQSIGFSLLSPQNPKFLNTATWFFDFWWASVGPVVSSIQTNMNTGMDYRSRVGVFLHVYMNYDTRLYQSNFQWNYATIGNLVGTHTEWDWVWGPQTYGDFVSYLIIAPNANAQPYDGADTIQALHENGVDNVGVDYAILSDFLDFRNAYAKYSQQLSAQKTADLQQQKNDIADYKNNLTDKLQAEKNSLQNLTLSMQQAMKNESASAERDIVNTVINAQNLKLSLLAAMR